MIEVIEAIFLIGTKQGIKFSDGSKRRNEWLRVEVNMRKPAHRKCKVCSACFIHQYSCIVWRCPEHSTICILGLGAKVKVKAEAKRIKAQYEIEKEGRKRCHTRIVELQLAGYYKTQAPQAFIASISARDDDFLCISRKKLIFQICMVGSGIVDTSNSRCQS